MFDMTCKIFKQSTKSGGLAIGAVGPSGFDDRIAARAISTMIGPWHQSYKQWLRLSPEQQLQPLNHQHRSPD